MRGEEVYLTESRDLFVLHTTDGKTLWVIALISRRVMVYEGMFLHVLPYPILTIRRVQIFFRVAMISDDYTTASQFVILEIFNNVYLCTTLIGRY